ncbi:MAG: Rpn family recombination-promoting nuclease/putative transposase [Planctomycetota bacterium]
MALGIDPTVDFAFKLMLGNPKYPEVTIHFLNAILRPEELIQSVEILNPIQGKDRSEDKIVVLDILAKDASGQRFNVEMQSTRQANLQRRLLYYSTLSYTRQIAEGEHYSVLRPVFSICVLSQNLFPRRVSPRYHNSFRLRCDQAELVFTNDLEFHTLELPKFGPSSDNVRDLPADEKWLYFLANAKTMDPSELATILGDPPLQKAIGILEMISKDPEDLQHYEARLKFLRDQHANMEAAKAAEKAALEKGLREGRALGQTIGLEEGREKGREEGREEGIDEGLRKGELFGRIRAMEEILGEAYSTDEQLQTLSLEELSERVEALRARLS